MKKTLAILALTAAGTFAYADMATTTTTTQTTMGTGTVTEFTPGSALVVKESSGPITYRYGDSVTYVTKSGKTLTADEASTRIRVGAPVSVSYSGEASDRVVNRIEIDDD